MNRTVKRIRAVIANAKPNDILVVCLAVLCVTAVAILLSFWAEDLEARYSTNDSFVASPDPKPVPVETPTPTPEPTPEPTPTQTPGAVIEFEEIPIQTPEQKPVLKPSQNSTMTFELSARYMAKTVYGEAGGCSTTEQAAVAWCILNWVDEKGYAATPENVAKISKWSDCFHGYVSSNPVTTEIHNLCMDVIGRWLQEKQGVTEVGRVLPREYLFFHGDGVHNYFRNAYIGGTRWNWSLPSPYGD